MNTADKITAISSLWPIVLAFITFIVWLARLEFKSISNSKRIERLEQKDDSIEELKREVTEINAKLTVLIPGYLGKDK